MCVYIDRLSDYKIINITIIWRMLYVYLYIVYILCTSRSSSYFVIYAIYDLKKQKQIMLFSFFSEQCVWNFFEA